MQEVWKIIPEYKDYSASNLGNIKRNSDNYILSKAKTQGYLQVSLYVNGKYIFRKVHRLVAKAFIPNPDNLPQVNHKDENKSNNRVDNLEWCTQDYNNKYGTRLKRVSNSLKGHRLSDTTIQKIRATTTNKQGKAVDLFDMQGNFIRTFISTKEAERITGFDHSKISARCKRDRPCRGDKYIWKYHNV